jgi:Fic family protein
VTLGAFEPVSERIRLMKVVDGEPISGYIRLMKYNWQMDGWPEFRFDLKGVDPKLVEIADRAGQLQGTMQALRDEDQDSAWVELMVSEAIKTSEIEGESLNRPVVASSIRNRLGLRPVPELANDPAARGAGELMVAVRESWDADLTEQTVLDWHSLLMMGRRDISVGAWRTHEDPMRVISAGPMGEVKTLFEAPPSDRVVQEMTRFVEWFNASRASIVHGPVRSALAHLYFESIHPFEDGNGRIGRAIAEKSISQGLGRPALLNLSQAINAGRQCYYTELGRAQHALEVSGWVDYFIDVMLEALDLAGEQIEFVLNKARLLDRCEGLLNSRQLKVVRRMLQEGPRGFEGGMNARKYGRMTEASKATATRDLQDLASKHVFEAKGGGRSTRYELVM